MPGCINGSQWACPALLLPCQHGSICLCFTVHYDHAEGMNSQMYFFISMYFFMCMVCMHMCVFSCVRAHIIASVGHMAMRKWGFMVGVGIFPSSCLSYSLQWDLSVKNTSWIGDAASLIIKPALGIPVAPSKAGVPDGCHTHRPFMYLWGIQTQVFLFVLQAF